jgi:hypothetical protein
MSAGVERLVPSVAVLRDWYAEDVDEWFSCLWGGHAWAATPLCLRVAMETEATSVALDMAVAAESDRRRGRAA